MPIKKVAGQSRVTDKGSKNITQSVGIGAGKMYSHIPDLTEQKRLEMDNHMSFRGKIKGFVMDSERDSCDFKKCVDFQSVGFQHKLENLHRIGEKNHEQRMPHGQKRIKDGKRPVEKKDKDPKIFK